MTDPMNDLRPGQPVSEEQKKALAKANADETANAHKMAADRRAQDSMNEPPLINSLADSIKGKLEALPPEENK